VRRLPHLAAALGVVLAAGLAAESADAEMSAKPLIAVLNPGPTGREQIFALPGFFQGLRELGYEHGKNVVIEERHADWKFDRLPTLADELVRLKPSVIFTFTGQGVQAASRATASIPIVVGASSDLVLRGFVASLSRPGGNVTGLTLINSELEPKRLELLRAVAPRIARVAVVVHPSNPNFVLYPGEFEPAARQLGLKLQRVDVTTIAELDAAFKEMTAGGIDGVLVANDAGLNAQARRIAELAVRYRLPAVSETQQFAQAGGLIGYGPDISEMFRRAAGYVDRVLKGARPGDLPIERPDKFVLVLNQKTARSLGLTLPQAVLARADQVIE
jgi:putative ABC transport system substrate-binding protein